MSGHALEGLAEDLQAPGYHVTPPLLGDTEVSQLLREVRRIWHEDLRGSPERTSAIRPQLQHLHLRSRLIASLCHHAELARIVGIVVGPDVDHVFNQAFVKAPGGDERGRVPWHQDASFAELDQIGINCWVALTPTSQESGCVRVSHQRPLLPHSWNESLSFPETRAEIEAPVDIPLRPGQVLVFTQHVPHSSEPNRSDGDRVGISLGYCSPTAKLRDGTSIFGARIPILRGGRHVPEMIRDHLRGKLDPGIESLLEELRAGGVDVDTNLRLVREAGSPEAAESALNRLLSVGSIDADPDAGNTFRE